MASSAEKTPLHHQLPIPFGTTAAPPPTPSTQPIFSSGSTTPDFLSHLLHRLPPTLSLSVPARRSCPLSSSTPTVADATTPPVISLYEPAPSLNSDILSAATQLGFFHLTHHPIPSKLPLSAESIALSLFNLPHDQKQLLFPNNWPLGHEIDDDDSTSGIESFCLDSACSTDSNTELDFDTLREYTREMEKLGLKVLEELASAVGFKNPGSDDLCSLLWISNGMNKPGRVYPYVVALHYQLKCQKQTVLSDSGWATALGLADSVFVTIGDIAQVWSNGKLKKVRGRPFPISNDDDNISPHCITMSVLLTLPVESTVNPLIPDLAPNEENGEPDSTNNGEKRTFNSSSFEDYAWRVYHERRYRD